MSAGAFGFGSTRRRLAAFVLAVLAAVSAPAQDERPRIVLAPIDASEVGTPTALALAGTIEQTLRLTLLLSDAGDIESVRFLLPHVSLRRTSLYFEREEISRAVYGSFSTDDAGALVVEVSVWRDDRPDEPDRFRRVIENAFAVFGLADELALEIGSSIVGRQLAFGEIVVEGVGSLDEFAVYADGQLLGRNATRFTLVAGERSVVVAVPGPLGDEPLESFAVTVPDGGVATVAIEPPEADDPADDTAAEGGAESAAQQASESSPVERVERGNLRVESNPAGAAVTLDDREIGETPLDLVGVPAGTYELRFAADYFRSETVVADVPPNRTAGVEVTLDVDRGSPEVARYLRPAPRATLVAAGGAVAKAALVFVPWVLGYEAILYDNNWLLPLAWGAIGGTIQLGHLYAGDDRSTLVLSGIATGVGALAVAGGAVAEYSNRTGAGWFPRGGGALGLVPLAVATIGGAVYDMVAAPAAAARANDAVVASIARSGELPDEPSPRARLFVEAGGGSLVSGGYSIPLVAEKIFLRPSAGASLASVSPFRVGALARAQLDYVPLGAQSRWLRPYMGPAVQVDYAAGQLGVSAGVDWGAAFVLDRLELTLASRTAYGIRSGSFVMTPVVGVRL